MPVASDKRAKITGHVGAVIIKRRGLIDGVPRCSGIQFGIIFVVRRLSRNYILLPNHQKYITHPKTCGPIPTIVVMEYTTSRREATSH